MIVDDNEDDRYILKRQLNKINFKGEIFEAENGQVALNFFKNHNKKKEISPDFFPPNLIFLDINMPVMDGFEFLEKFSLLRNSTNQYHSVVFILFTSSESDENILKAKPYDFIKSFTMKGSLTKEKLSTMIQDSSF